MSPSVPSSNESVSTSQRVFRWLTGFAIAFVTVGIYLGTLILQMGHNKDPLLPIIQGASIILAAVLSMNLLGRLDLILHPIGGRVEKRWRDLRIVKLFEHITGEPELAGIQIGVLAGIGIALHGDLIPMLQTQGHEMLAMALTLYGIMSAANLVVHHMVPLIGSIERLFGTRIAFIVASLLSSLTGEPAAAVFLIEYTRKRTPVGAEPDVATGLATMIGSGGGLTYFAAPPILIIWSTLSSEFGWGLFDLLKFVGAGCTLHVIVTSFPLLAHLQRPNEDTLPRFTMENALGLLPLAGVVAMHVIWHESPWPVMVADICVGVFATRKAHATYAQMNSNTVEDFDEKRFTAMWLPLILGLLLIALELIGHVGDPFVSWVARQIPVNIPLFAVGVILFFLTAIVSHFADNALASRVFIMIPIAMMGMDGTVDPNLFTIGFDQAQFLAIAIVSGALFGSLLTISANIPNFPIARGFGVTPGEWIRVSWRYYWTSIAYLVWLAICYTLYVP